MRKMKRKEVIVLVACLIAVVVGSLLALNYLTLATVDINQKISKDLMPNGGVFEMDWNHYSYVYSMTGYSVNEKSSWEQFVTAFRQKGNDTAIMLDSAKQVVWIKTSETEIAYFEYSPKGFLF